MILYGQKQKQKKDWLESSFQLVLLFPIKLSIVNAVFDEFCWMVVEIFGVDTGGNNGRDIGGIKGKYRFVGTNGNGNKGNKDDSWWK